MEMRIVAGDSESACVLADALTVAFGDARVSLRPDRPNVEVRVRGRSDQTVSPGAGHSRSLARPCQLQIGRDVARGALVRDRALGPGGAVAMTYATTQPAAADPMRDVPQLDWKAFSARFFPERRRHDLEALHAYGAYRKGLPVGEASPSDAAVEAWEGEGGR